MAEIKLKRCPGFTDGGIAPHELPATEEHFHRNAGNGDGLSSRCRTCGRAYSNAWAAKKRAAAAAAGGAQGPDSRHTEELIAAEAVATPAPAPAALAVSDVRPTREYADQLAVAAARGKAPGYSTEIIDGLTYALPTSPEAVGSDAGQAALAAINEARTAERRRRDAARKRDERARAKARAGGATA